MRSLLPAVAEQLFKDIQKIYEEKSQSKDGAAKFTILLTNTSY